MTDVDRKSQENLLRARIAREIQAADSGDHADRVVLVVSILTTEHSNASQLTQRVLFDLPNAFSADAKNGGDFLERVFPFACHDERAVASRTQAVLTVPAVFEVIAALGLATDPSVVAVRAVTY